MFCVIGASGSAADRADESERLLTDCATVIDSKVISMDSQLKEKDKQVSYPWLKALGFLSRDSNFSM